MQLSKQQYAGIVSELGLENTDAETQQKIITDLENAIGDRVLGEVIANLDEGQQAQLKQAIENEDQDAIHSVIAENNIDLSALVEEGAQKTVEQFKKYKKT